MTVIGFAALCATNYDIVSVKFHTPDVSTDPIGTTVAVSYKAGGVSGFTQIITLGALTLAVPTTGVFRAIYDNAGMLFAKAAYQCVTGAGSITGGSNSVHSGASVTCANPGVIVALGYIDGSSLSDTTWAGTGATEVFDESVISNSQWWSMATYSTPGSISLSLSSAGSPVTTRAAAIALGV
jgi:hypothetical protein